MIISKYNKTYDTSDGSEQQYEDPRQPKAGSVGAKRRGLPPSHGMQGPRPAGASAAKQRWEDDGGPPRTEPPVSPLEFSAKPSWSVQSLRDLNLAIRLGDWPDNPTTLRRHAAEAERARVASLALKAQRAADRAHAERHRDRNPWEHT